MDSMATSLVPRILRDFRREAPHVRVALQQKPGHADDPRPRLGPDRAGDHRAAAGPYGWLPLQRQRLVLVVPAGHRLAARRQARLDELADEDFVTVPAGFGFRSLIDDLLAADGASVRVAFESPDMAAIEGLVGAGLGVAILPERFAGVSGTVGVDLAAVHAERIVGLTWRTDRALPPTAARLLEFLSRTGPFD